jgi:periplasmic protein CpxP/Spy
VKLTTAALFAMALGAPSLAMAQTQPQTESPTAAAPSVPQSQAPASPSGTMQNAPRATTPGASTPESSQRVKRVDARIAQLHSQLKITKEQEPLWNKFAQVMRDNAEHMAAAIQQRHAELGTMNAADNMQNFAQNATNAAQDLQNLSTAFHDLYNNFPEDQKKVADQVFQERAQTHQRHG